MQYKHVCGMLIPARTKGLLIKSVLVNSQASEAKNRLRLELTLLLVSGPGSSSLICFAWQGDMRKFLQRACKVLHATPRRGRTRMPTGLPDSPVHRRSVHSDDAGRCSVQTVWKFKTTATKQSKCRPTPTMFESNAKTKIRLTLHLVCRAKRCLEVSDRIQICNCSSASEQKQSMLKASMLQLSKPNQLRLRQLEASARSE